MSPEVIANLDAIKVNMNAANDIAMRLWYSTSNGFMFAIPRALCLSIYSLSCGLVIVSCCPSDMRKSLGSILIIVSSGMRFSERIISLLSFSSRIVQFLAVHLFFTSG